MFSCILLVLFSVFIVSFIQIHGFYSYSWVFEVITQNTAYTGNCLNLKKKLGVLTTIRQLWQREGNNVSKKCCLDPWVYFNLEMTILLESQPFSLINVDWRILIFLVWKIKLLTWPFLKDVRRYKNAEFSDVQFQNLQGSLSIYVEQHHFGT